MRFWKPLVTCALMAIMLLLPYASLSACTPESQMRSHCPPDCPMKAQMMRVADHAPASSTAVNSNCCTIESAKPAPITESQVAPQAVAHAAQEATPIGLVLVSAKLPSEFDTSPPLCRSSQSLLCTFQI